VIAAASLAVPEKKSESMASSAAAKQAAAKPKVQVTPISLRGGGGIGAVGTF
jgi:hypothetical protein